MRPACLSSRRSTTRSPCPDGSVETRTSTARPAMRSEMRPSCGKRRSAMSSLDMTLMRETTSGATARLVCRTSRSTPSTRKRITSRFSIRLDMDVRRVFLDGLGQQRVDQPDDGRVVVALQQVRGLGNVLGQMREVGVVVEALEHLHRGAGAGLIGDAQHLVELLHGHARELQGHADEAAHLGQAQRRHAGAADGVGGAVDDAADQHTVPLCERERKFAFLRQRFEFGVQGPGPACGVSGAARCAAGCAAGTCRGGMTGITGCRCPGRRVTLPPCIDSC